MPWGRSIVMWWVMLVAIVALGALRQAWLEPAVGELRAHQIGTLAACALVLALCAVFVRWAALDADDALRVGVFWLALCLLFEFGFFHFARGVPWPVLLHDYDLRHGRLLPLLWATVLAGPYVVLKLGAR